MVRPFISLLTDFGLRDPSAAICHGVIATIAPEANVVDISHEVRKYAVRDGALLLWCALPYLPVGVHVAVVDPGVGTARRPLAIRTGRGDTLIGPDNGLLLPAATRIGGAVEARELTNPDLRLPVVSSSFHGRDIFAPAAAHVAIGVPFDQVGPVVGIQALVDLALPSPVVGDGVLESAVIYIDTFGNVKLAGLLEDLVAAMGPLTDGDALQIELGTEEPRREIVPWATTFGSVPPGSPLLYEDSYGRLCLAENQGDVASTFSLTEDVPITIRRASPGRPLS
jgi:S-adenosylmethionine hydrolase